MIIRFLTIWIIIVLIVLIIELIRWIRKPKGFKYKLYNTDRWLDGSQIIIGVTILAVMTVVATIIAVYIIEGIEIFLKFK